MLLVVIVAIGASFAPKLVDEVNGFVQATPNYVDDLTHGRGRLGFLETKYHVVEKVREQVKNGGASRVLGLSGTALSVTKSVISIVTATVTIVFLTFFMLLEGGAWVERFYTLLPERSQRRWRSVGHDIHRTVGGYVTGNLADQPDRRHVTTTIVLLIMGVPYAVALGLLVAILDLIPLAGATVAGIIVVAVAFLHSVPAGIVLLIFVIAYQQLENHVLQPRGLRADRAALAARRPHLRAGRCRARGHPRRSGGDPGRRLAPGGRAGRPRGPARDTKPRLIPVTLAGTGARSSVEERRPSKPLVGGSNPPGRTCSTAMCCQHRLWYGLQH